MLTNVKQKRSYFAQIREYTQNPCYYVFILINYIYEKEKSNI